MPIVDLEFGHSIPLSACKDRDEMLETTVANNADSEGKYVISYDLMPLSVQYTIAPGHHVTLCSPEGMLQNDGGTSLTVTTPGL